MLCAIFVGRFSLIGLTSCRSAAVRRHPAPMAPLPLPHAVGEIGEAVPVVRRQIVAAGATTRFRRTSPPSSDAFYGSCLEMSPSAWRPAAAGGSKLRLDGLSTATEPAPRLGEGTSGSRTRCGQRPANQTAEPIGRRRSANPSRRGYRKVPAGGVVFRLS